MMTVSDASFRRVTKVPWLSRQQSTSDLSQSIIIILIISINHPLH
jgi:hypothetical protein